MGRIESTTNITENYNGWTGEELVSKLGASYQSGRDIKEIAKDIRQLIRKAVKGGYLPKSLKASVTIERYSMGQSLNVTIKECHECVLNVNAWRTQAANGFNLSWADLGGQYNTTGQQIMNTLQLFADAFNKSEHHGQSDYHNTAFHAHITFSSELRSAQKTQVLESEES